MTFRSPLVGGSAGPREITRSGDFSLHTCALATGGLIGATKVPLVRVRFEYFEFTGSHVPNLPRASALSVPLQLIVGH